MSDNSNITGRTSTEVSGLQKPISDYRSSAVRNLGTEYIDNVLSELGLEGNVAAKHSIAQAMLDAGHDSSIRAEAEKVSREMLAETTCAEVYSTGDHVDPEFDPIIGKSSSNRPVPEGMIPDEVDREDTHGSFGDMGSSFDDIYMTFLEALMDPRPFDPSTLFDDRKVESRPTTPKLYSVSELLDEILGPLSARPKDGRADTPMVPPRQDLASGVTVQESPTYAGTGEPTEVVNTSRLVPTAWMMVVREWPLGPVINRGVRLVSDLTPRDKELIGNRNKVIEYRDNRNYYVTLSPLYI